MPFLKNYAYTPFILLLHGVAVSASPDISYNTDKKDYLSSLDMKPKLSWEKKLRLKLIKIHIALPLAIRDAAICGKRKKKRRMTSEYNVISKKNSITPINDCSKIHIQFSIVEHYA